MPTTPRPTPKKDIALIGQFIFWAAQVQDCTGVVLIGDPEKACIDAAARRLFRLLRYEGNARRARARLTQSRQEENTP